MNSNSTTITYEKVKQDANTIKECSTVMKNIFDDFGKAMSLVGADDVFAGNASEKLSERFNTLKTRFEGYTKNVEKFSNMITSAAESTERTEASIAHNVEDLMQ